MVLIIGIGIGIVIKITMNKFLWVGGLIIFYHLMYVFEKVHATYVGIFDIFSVIKEYRLPE